MSEVPDQTRDAEAVAMAAATNPEWVLDRLRERDQAVALLRDNHRMVWKPHTTAGCRTCAFLASLGEMG